MATVRKAFDFIPEDKVLTHVNDTVSAFVPDQSIGLREMLMRFAYIGSERLEEIVNRGFDGDEDDDILGVDVGALDYSEVHDRVADLVRQPTTKSVHNVTDSPESKEIATEDSPDEDAQPSA